MQISKFFPRPLIAIFALAVLGLAVALGLLVRAERKAELPLAKPSFIGGPFSLQDLEGLTVTEKDLLGHFSLIFFGTTSDRNIMPTELRVIATSLELLGDKATDLKTYVVTLDPASDQPEKFKTYLADISPRLKGLTGTPEQIAAMARTYHLGITPEPGKSAMDYSPLIYLMGRDGKFITPFAFTVDAKDLAEGLKKVLE